MGQRGQRKARRRCAYVDVRTGLQCARRTKRAGRRFCSRSHAARARLQTSRPVVEPAARVRHRLAREKDVARLEAQLRNVADEHGRVTVTAALPVVMAVFDVRYQRGYTAGRAKRRFEVRQLRLTASKAALDQFLGSRFGKAFITGDLKPEDLARFKFAGTR